jgi:hypothetical protein
MLLPRQASKRYRERAVCQYSKIVVYWKYCVAASPSRQLVEDAPTMCEVEIRHRGVCRWWLQRLWLASPLDLEALSGLARPLASVLTYLKFPILSLI